MWLVLSLIVGSFITLIMLTVGGDNLRGGVEGTGNTACASALQSTCQINDYEHTFQNEPAACGEKFNGVEIQGSSCAGPDSEGIIE